MFPSNSTFLQLKYYVAKAFGIDSPTSVVISLEDGSTLMLFDDAPIGEVLSSGTTYTLTVEDSTIGMSQPRVVFDKPAVKPESFNGILSEDEALAFALQEQAQVTIKEKYINSYSNSFSPLPHLFTPPVENAPFQQSLSLHDKIGTILCQGSTSQYSFENGRSACTAICLLAVGHLLSSCCHNMADVSAEIVDGIVEQGILKHSTTKTSSEHSSLDDIWNHPTFEDVVPLLIRGPIYQASLHKPKLLNSEWLSTHAKQKGTVTGYKDALCHAVSFAALSNTTRVAMVLTTSGETVLCVKGVDNNYDRWYLFDSHGQSHEKVKKAYIKEFQSMDSLASALVFKYPMQDFGDDSLLSEMYNTFETYPITMMSGASPPLGNAPCQDLDEDASIHSALRLSREFSSPIDDKKSPDETFESQSNLPPPPELHFKVSTPKKCSQKMPHDMKSDGQRTDNADTENASSNETSVPSDIFLQARDPTMQQLVKDDFLDPILGEVMADPVNCQDGYTYERSSIERCFRGRIQEEEERLAATTDPNTDDSACCGRRGPIQLTSPMTQEVLLSNILIPCRGIERQIVRYVENGALGMTQDEIDEWHQKREQKRINDRAREDQRREVQENERRQQEQAELAAQRRTMESQASVNSQSRSHVTCEGHNGDAEIKPCERVRVDRNVRLQRERISDSDIGLSAALCEEGDRIFLDYMVAFGQSMECMVTSCTNKLNKENPSWCARCGRLVCRRCLKFSLTDINETNPTKLHDVCVDCVTQLIDVLNTTDHRISQTRAIIQHVYVDPYFAELSNILSDFQDIIVFYETGEHLRPQLHKIGLEIHELEVRRSTLETVIAQAQEVTERARQGELHACDSETSREGTSTQEGAEHLRAQRQDLEKELLQLREKGPPKDEEGQLQYVIRLGELTCQLEATEMDLSMALSNEIDQGVPGSSEALERQCAEYEGQLEAMQREHPPEDEVGQVQYATRLSEICDMLDDARLKLAQSRCCPVDSPIAPRETPKLREISFPASAMKHLLDLLEECPPGKRQGIFQKRRRKELDILALQSLVTGLDHTCNFEESAENIYREIDHLPSDIKDMFANEIEAAKTEVANGVLQRAQEDSMAEYLRLQSLDKSTLTEDKALDITMRLSELDATFRSAEYALLSEGNHIDSEQAPEEASPSPETIFLTENLDGTMVSSRDESRSFIGGLIKTLGYAAEYAFRVQPLPSISPEQEVPSTKMLSKKIVHMSSVFHSPTEGESFFDTMMDAMQDVCNAFDCTVSVTHSLCEFTPRISVSECRARLEALCSSGIEWPLPLGLEFPTSRMTQHLEILQNTLTIRRLASQRSWEEVFSRIEKSIQVKHSSLEDQVSMLMAEANTAQQTAQAAQVELEERRQKREAERKRQEAIRQERERERQEQERLARREAENLRQRHREDELRTEQAFAQARGASGNARMFGGVGDLRMCGRCKTGPFENRACADLDAHNNNETEYKSTPVASSDRPNDCPNCGWHDGNWHNWPYWDGIHGPH